MRLFCLTLLSLLLWTGMSGETRAAPTPEEGIRALILHGRLPALPRRPADRAQLKALYEPEQFRPMWLGTKSSHAHLLLDTFVNAEEEGLEPSDYAVQDLRDRLDAPGDAAHMAETDVLLSAAALRYMSDMAVGRVVPGKIDPELLIIRQKVDVLPLLRDAIKNQSLRDTLAALTPDIPEYRSLREALAKYRCIMAYGGWEKIKEGQDLYPGMRDPRVPQIEARLALEGLLPSYYSRGGGVFDAFLDDVQEPLYTDALAQAVAHFQTMRGLHGDGAIGPRTLAALNVPVQERITHILLNMERWRWTPRNLGARHIRVNIAGFDLQAFEGGREVLAMKIIVGKPYQRTPVFSSAMTDVTFHPYWYAPNRIATETILPIIKKDVNYLKEEGFSVFRRAEKGLVPVPIGSVNWSSIQSQNFPYLLRQDPGPRNALGNVRFNIQSQYNIYLHDTPWRDLFFEENRALGAGCIRLERAQDLLYFVMDSVPEWDRSRLEETFNAEGMQPLVVPLPQPIPVHVLYITAWVDDAGNTHFRDDIYGRDVTLKKALYK